MKELDTTASSEFEQTLQIYSSSFPAVETKPVEKIVDMLKNDHDYHLLVAVKDRLVVGMALLYVFRSLGIGLLDYMAVTLGHQGRGIGSKLFRYTLERFRAEVTNPTGLLLEVQKEDVNDSAERRKRIDRIRFYARLGAKILVGVNYRLPPQHGSDPEETYLMIVPLKNLRSLSKNSILEFVKAVYSRVYRYQSDDLLDMVARDLPRTIRISDVKVN